jgi:hypothetical protein
MGAGRRKKVNGQHSTCEANKITGCCFALPDDGAAGAAPERKNDKYVVTKGGFF